MTKKQPAGGCCRLHLACVPPKSLSGPRPNRARDRNPARSQRGRPRPRRHPGTIPPRAVSFAIRATSLRTRPEPQPVRVPAAPGLPPRWTTVFPDFLTAPLNPR
jgi:hypothetical protein